MSAPASNSALRLERPADFLVENRLRRLSGSVNADETSRVGEEREETVRRDRERALDDDEVERPAIGRPPVERTLDHDDIRPALELGPRRRRRAQIRFQHDHLRAHGVEKGRAIAGSAPDIEGAIARNDHRRLQHPRQRQRRQELASRAATRRQFAIEIGERIQIPERRSAGAAFRETPPTGICRQFRRCAAGR